ncbi:methyl-accepting chemotaxis protein [Microvirga flocculans]|uniref:Methyl-accepting chemotaxis protein n=1 Tax=Microvirga flocculans TaxID=217168 RepID=A0A7W6N6C6_9HYPH|nr:methyl-accepting chemotaxis protein [Microvirga flocculans]MBB4038536.1 methyl-accepting chemotaxis protein [Microvirga flocculans]
MTISIANRILLGFAVIVALIVGLGLYAINQIDDVRQSTEAIVTRDLTVMRQIESLGDQQNMMRGVREEILSRYLLRALGQQQSNPDDLIRVWEQQANATEASMAQALSTANDYASRSLTQQRADAWKRISDLLNRANGDLRQLRSTTERQFSALQSNDLAAVLSTQSSLNASRDSWRKNLEQARSILSEAIILGQQRVGEVYEQSRLSIILAMVGAAVLSILITYALRSSITGPLSAFMSFVERVGRGELGGQMAITGKDEIGHLGATLNAMVEGLRQLASQSREATENLNAAAAEIRASTQEQAASVEEQLAAVQETAATVDEITHSGTQIGKRAQEVIASAQAAAQTSMAGLQAVEDTARAMDAIREQAEAVAENIVALSEKTQAVGEIVASVNDISERTHLLALNAAIEAAAAGENGRSFAVVASEMKTLADQAKDATTQVRSILGDIQRGINSSVMLTEEAVKRVSAGKERTDITQQTITGISSQIQESVQTFQQIVASTNQQQLGIEQVMGALQNIRQASQQTAAGTRQLETAAGNLSTLAQQLLGLVERYRL